MIIFTMKEAMADVGKCMTSLISIYMGQITGNFFSYNNMVSTLQQGVPLGRRNAALALWTALTFHLFFFPLRVS